MKTRTTITRWISSLILLSVMLLQVGGIANAASKKGMSKSDFVLTINGKKTDFFKLTPKQAEKTFGKKFKEDPEGDNSDRYYLSIKGGTLYTWSPDESDYVNFAYFTSGVKTARGIKIGSTLKQVLNAYPKPLAISESYQGETTYSFGKAVPEEYWDEGSSVKMPDYTYALAFTINDKTGKVVEIALWDQLAP